MKLNDRHQLGIDAISSIVKFWIDKSLISYPQLVSIAAWGTGEAGLIDKTVISRVVNGKLPMGCSLRALLALSRANSVIHAWHTGSPEDAIAGFGPFQKWGVMERSMKTAIWIPSVKDGRLPMSFNDLCRIQVGLQSPPSDICESSPAGLTAA